MSEQRIHWVGIDTSKSTFEAALVLDGQHFPDTPLGKVPAKRFPRTQEGAERCAAWVRECLDDLEGQASARAVMEASGGFSLDLCVWLVAAWPALAPAIVNPKRTSKFIASMGLRNKTDRMDARALAFFGAERRPVPYEPMTPERCKLRELSRYRDALVEASVAFRHRDEQAPQTELVRSMQARRIEQYKQDIAEIENEMKRIINESPELKQDFDVWTTIPGVGFITAVVILAEMGDLRRFARSRQAAAFSGASPKRRESGTSVNGRPRMCKEGSPRVRQALYMAAMTAVRKPGPLQQTYDRLVAQGKPKLVALGAVMRKLIVLMRALSIHQTPYDPCGKPCGKHVA